MTDQRPIDPSTLRDGDIVRAKRGEHGVVGGVFCRLDRGGWCLHDGPKRARETAWSIGRWTITDVLRPVLVKGDRVTWGGPTAATVEVVDGDHVHVMRDDGKPDVWHIDNCTRLPAASEPAPIEVGGDLHPVIAAALEAHRARYSDQGDGTHVCRDCAAVVKDGYLMGHDILHDAIGWPVLTPVEEAEEPIEVGSWWDLNGGKPHVIVSQGCGDPYTLRPWDSGEATERVYGQHLRDYWHRLDDPPEPEVRQVYVIGDQAFVHSSDFGHQVTGAAGPSLAWSTICDVWSDRLATLQIVHTLEAE